MALALSRLSVSCCKLSQRAEEGDRLNRESKRRNYRPRSPWWSYLCRTPNSQLPQCLRRNDQERVWVYQRFGKDHFLVCWILQCLQRCERGQGIFRNAQGSDLYTGFY